MTYAYNYVISALKGLTLKWMCKKLKNSYGTLDGFGICMHPREHFVKDATLRPPYGLG